jgi:hypothetical protein
MLARRGCPFAACLALVFLATLVGCESSGSSLKNVDVVYRFDNVRKSAEVDEWAEVRSVLAKHSTRISSSVDAVRSNGPVEVRAYKAIVNVPNVRAIDAIQSDLEKLAGSRSAKSSDRIQFTLTSLTADYRSNILTAGIESIVGGYASPGYHVLVHPFEGAPPLRSKAGADGRWTQKLTALPQTRWVYAAVRDPAGKLPDKHYRINISTQQQEAIDPKEYARIFPPEVRSPSAAFAQAPTSPASATLGSPRTTPSVSPAIEPGGVSIGDDSDAVRARSAEDERIRLKREREEESRRKIRELEERIDQRLRDAERRERGQKS